MYLSKSPGPEPDILLWEESALAVSGEGLVPARACTGRPAEREAALKVTFLFSFFLMSHLLSWLASGWCCATVEENGEGQIVVGAREP